MVKDALQNSPTMPTEGGALAFRQAKWRAGQIGRATGVPTTLHRLGIAEDVGRAIHDPNRALHDPRVQGMAERGLDWAVREHPEAVAAVGGIVAANAAVGAYGTYKALTGDDNGGEEGAPAEEKKQGPYNVAASPHLDSIQEIGLTQFHADRSQAVNGRRPAAARRLGTVQRSTMPRKVGPSNWYGPQGGYNAGRGFQQPDRRRDVLGV
jgi:hypothetical protein